MYNNQAPRINNQYPQSNRSQINSAIQTRITRHPLQSHFPHSLIQIIRRRLVILRKIRSNRQWLKNTLCRYG